MNWLKELKEGDEVVVCTSGAFLTGAPQYVLETVTKVTKTQVEVGNHRYLVSTGYRYGRTSGISLHGWPRLKQATTEMRLLVVEDARRCSLSNALYYFSNHKNSIPAHVADLIIQAYFLDHRRGQG